MRVFARHIAGGLSLFAFAAPVVDASADEVKALMTQAVRSVMEELGPKFEKASGHKLTMTFGVSGAMAKRIQDGDTADLLVSTRSAVDGLIIAGKVAPGFDTTLARSMIGVAVKRGASKPDISTVDAFKRSLLGARAISYTNPAGGGPSGVHFAKVLERLGIAEEIRAKTVFTPVGGGLAAQFLVSGEAEIAIQQISELISVSGAELVGPLPNDLQLLTIYVAAIPITARGPEAADELVGFLQSPEALATMKAKGLEPGG